MHHRQPQRLAVQPPAQHQRVAAADTELRRDILDHSLVGRRGGGQHRHAVAQLADQRADAPVVGPEVVAPVGDAVRLVDHDQAGVARQLRQHVVAEVGVVQPFRADQQHVELTAATRACTSSHSATLPELIVAARTPARSAAATWLRISASSGDTMTVGPWPRSRAASRR